jgi:cytochrome bd-type quinol oxidase subunit 1
MTVASLAWIAYKTGWYFYALGPQLVICMVLGYLAARKTAGDLLTWLVIGFLAALVPLAGVVIMLSLWWRAGAERPRGAPENGEPPA